MCLKYLNFIIITNYFRVRDMEDAIKIKPSTNIVLTPDEADFIFMIENVTD